MERGTLKSFCDDTGYGFIKCDSLGKDIFLRRAELPADGLVEPGRPARFILSYDARSRPQARDVVWGALASGVADVGGYSDAPPVAGASGAGADKEENRRYCGRLKTVGERYGFIECSEAQAEFGRDVFVSRALLPPGLGLDFLRSLPVYFRLSVNARGQPQARDVDFGGDGLFRAGDRAPAEPSTGKALRW